MNIRRSWNLKSVIWVKFWAGQRQSACVPGRVPVQPEKEYSENNKYFYKIIWFMNCQSTYFLATIISTSAMSEICDRREPLFHPLLLHRHQCRDSFTVSPSSHSTKWFPLPPVEAPIREQSVAYYRSAKWVTKFRFDLASDNRSDSSLRPLGQGTSLLQR
jgi:hypothetical protein